MPPGWTDMTREEAGFNAITMMFYYLMLRPVSKRHQRLAMRLYNVYSLGYPLGADSRDTLWPQDVSDRSAAP